MKEPCYMCNNARLDDELTDKNDYHAKTIGDMPYGSRLMLVSGGCKPLRIEYDSWSCTSKVWRTHGVYYPKCCPECGREIKEYDNERTCKN